MQLEGDFSDALEEARRAAERCPRGEDPGAAGEAWYRQGEIHHCAVTSAQPRRPIGREPARTRATAGPCSAATRSGRAPRGGEHVRRVVAETQAVGERRDPPGLRRDHARGRRHRGRRAPAASSSRSPRVMRGAPSGRWRRRRGARSSSPRATPSARWHRFATQGPYGGSSRRPTRRPACGARRPRLPCSPGRGHGELELEASRAAYSELGASPDLARLRSLGGDPRGDVHELTIASLRSSATSPPATRIRRSPASWCSASAPSIGT